jgi:hypothetical protein
VSATLQLSRNAPFGFELVRHPFEVLIDGNTVGTVPMHGALEQPVEIGHHVIRLRAGRRTSQERSFYASEGEVIGFWCYGARLWPLYVASFAKPDLGISLKRK